MYHRAAMPKRHVIISGTGRAGTTFLMHLLFNLGLPTGFGNAADHIDSNCNAGLEWGDMRDPKAPYIIKNPRFCESLGPAVESGEVIVDHAIIPVRDLFSAAKSRGDVTRRTDPARYANCPEIPGGLWLTDDPTKQEGILAAQLSSLIHALAKYDIPATFLYFPRFIHDPGYLYGKLGFLFEGIDYGRFLAQFTATARPELIHEFQPGQ